jgi:hypothetical protein
VYEVDGGEWLDFVGADLKSLSPRPEPRQRNGAAVRPERAERLERHERPERQEEREEAAAEIIQHPAADPAPAPGPAPMPVMAEDAAAEPAAPRYDDAAALAYEPDQERRDKFLSRFSRWAKKG